MFYMAKSFTEGPSKRAISVSASVAYSIRQVSSKYSILSMYGHRNGGRNVCDEVARSPKA